MFVNRLKCSRAVTLAMALSLATSAHASDGATLRTTILDDAVMACTAELTHGVETLRDLVASDKGVHRAWILYDSDERCPSTDFTIPVGDERPRVRASLGVVRSIERARWNVTLFLESGEGSATRIRKVKLLCTDSACKTID